MGGFQVPNDSRKTGSDKTQGMWTDPGINFPLDLNLFYHSPQLLSYFL